MPETLLTFVHISDTHLHQNPDYRPEWFSFPLRKGAEALVRQLQELPFKPDFVLHTGDVAYDPDPAAYPAARELLSQIPYPLLVVPGNHDHSPTLQQVLLGRETARRPFYEAHDINGVQVVCLDSNGPAPHPAGSVVPEQLDWLASLCAARDDRPMVIAVHHNVLPVGIPWLDDYMRMTNGEDFHRALLPARDRIRGVFFGHVHQNISMIRDGILYTSVLSTWAQIHAWPGQVETIFDQDAEPGFNVVTLTRDQTYIRRCRFPLPTP